MNAIRHCICLPVIIFILGELHFTSGLFAADNSERKVEGNEIFYGHVLITGAAGFIGFHLSKRLKDSFQLSADGTVVVGMDNFSPSYDVTLKEARALELKKSGVDLHRASVCEEDYVRFLFEKHDFTHVVHLAAEPGVRHSLEDPSDYIPNISCFAVLLDVVKDYSGVSVLLASSSTVYGSPGPVPFSVSHSYPDPQNMYALSKKTNEMFAESYCHEYMIQSIVLRFFTVYGPWGRPDMAVYKFTQQLYEGKPLNVSLWTSDRRPVMRDFTYIDDVIDGVVMAMKYRPKLCGETFNMGFGSPVSMATMLHHLEEEMGIKGNVVEVPLNPAELPITHSDNTESKEKLGFEPKVSLTNGLHRFVLWFRQYSQTRDALSKDPQANLEMKELTERSNKIRNKLIAAAVTKDNKVYKKRLKGLQQTFINYAKTENIPLPKLEKKGFIFYPGVVAKGTQVAHSPSLANNAKALAKKCSEVEVCVGFSPDGYLFSDFDKREKWSKVKENEGGLYVADVDMCVSDLHHCPKHSTCVHEGPASYRCECEEGYATSQCIPILSEKVRHELEEEASFEDYVNDIDRNSMKKNKEFIFFPGKDSGGGDYAVVQDSTSFNQLKEICRDLRGCLGFNTNGVLKSSLKPSTSWYTWTTDDNHGLYVLDVDYCFLNDEGCPLHSSCHRRGPGDYRCTCDDPLVMDEKEQVCVEVDNSKGAGPHILMSVDKDYWVGLVTAINSILRAAQSPHLVKFHIVVSGVERERLLSYLQCYDILLPDQVEVAEMNPDWVRGNIKVHMDSAVVGNLASLGNFARFYFHRLFPDLTRGIYLDSDIIVKGDIFQFWDTLLDSNKILIAAKRTTPTYQSVFSKEAEAIFEQRYGYRYGPKDPTFNAGVYGINLQLWKEKRVTEEVEYWMRENKRSPLWQYGTQPLMLITLYQEWDYLDPRWNFNGLGWNTQINPTRLDEAFLLHWSGKMKPWLSNGLYQSYWLPYRPVECSNHGNCIESDNRFQCN